VTAPPKPQLAPVPEGDPAPAPTPLALNYNRRAILRAVAIALERGEVPTHSVIRPIADIPERSAPRALKWAVENGVLVKLIERG